MNTLKPIVFVCAAALAPTAFADDGYFWCYAVMGGGGSRRNNSGITVA